MQTQTNLQNLENGKVTFLEKYKCYCKKQDNYLTIIYQGEKYTIVKEDIMQIIFQNEIPDDAFGEFLKNNAQKVKTENQYSEGLSDFQWKIVEDGGQNEFKIKEVNKGDVNTVSFVYPNKATTGGRYRIIISRSDHVSITDWPPKKKLNIQKNLDKKEQENFFELLKENNKQNKLIELLQGKAIGGNKHGDRIKETSYIPETYNSNINYNAENEDEEPHDTLPDDMFERLNDLNSKQLIGDGKFEENTYYFTSFGLPLSINKDNTLNILDNNRQSTFNKTINGDDFYNLVNSIKQNDTDMFIQSAFMLNKNSTIKTLPADQAYQYYTYNDYTPKNCNYSYSDNFYNSINTYNDNSTYYTNNYNYF